MISYFPRLAQAGWRVRVFAALAIATVLSACGGGGGSDGPAATVTVDRSTVALADTYEDEYPAPQTLNVQVTGHGIADVGLAYDPAYPAEDWVGAELAGAAPSYQLTIGAASPTTPGEHTAHLLFGAVDDKGNVLDSTPIVVTYKVVARLRTDMPTIAMEGVNGAAAPETVHFSVSGEGLSWTASSPQGWIRIGNASGTGPAQIDVDVDDSGLASGTHAGSIVITSTDGQSITIPVTFTLTSTSLSVSSTSLSFGGATGRDAGAQTLQLSLGTDGNAYEWELQSFPAWLIPSATSGTVSSAPQDVSFTPDFAAAGQGQSSATLTFVAHVNGDLVEQQVSVALKVDGHRLHASEDGVALASTPSWSRLTRTIKVNENFGQAVAWTASSDKSWLSVTSSGVAGGNLVLTANPAAVATDSLSIATVTIKTSDSKIANATVRVGLWKGASTPAAVVTKTGVNYIRIANDPVRPYVYAHDGTSTIDVYHAYTGAKVATITGVGNTLRDMAVGTDGRNLYVVDEGFKRIAVIDLNTMARTRTITTSGPTDAGYTLVATRVTGVEVLLGGDGTAYRASDGAVVSLATGLRYHMTASRDGSHLYYINWGLSPASAGGYVADYTAAAGGALLTTPIPSSMDVGSDGDDIAVSADGATLYTASSTSNNGAPYVFKTFDATTLSAIGHLPPVTIWPTSVEAASDGRVAGGVSGTYEDYDICLYSKTGALLRKYKVAGYAQTLAGQNLVFTGDALMLVATTTDPKLVFIPVGP
ncbi:YncE family protein [Ideonella sp. YS5]|uniref:YncE family protein n=1 Tax=Ideonella sp. YS5 TaxID=3453714 RepID=UPI003EEC8AD5